MQRPFLFLISSSDPLTLTTTEQQDLAVSAPLTCRKCAFQILSLCRTYKKHYSLQCVVFIVAHFLLNACTIHLVDRANTDLSISINANSALEECLDVLEEMATVWEVAQNAIALVKALKKKHDDQNSHNTNETGQNANKDGEGIDLDLNARELFDGWALFSNFYDSYTA